MKKFTALLCVFALMLCVFAGCKKDQNNIGNHTWTFSHVQHSGTDVTVLYCSADNQKVYPGAEVLNLTLSYADGIITLAHPDGRSWEIEASSGEETGLGSSHKLTYIPDPSETKAETTSAETASADETAAENKMPEKILGIGSIGSINYEDYTEYFLTLNIGGYILTFVEIK